MKWIKSYEALDTSELPLEKIGQPEFLDFLKRYCGQFLEVAKDIDWSEFSHYSGPINLLYRRFRHDWGNYIYVDPKESDRRRIAPFAGTNFHNLFVSNLDSWSDYPRRNKSLISAGWNRASTHYGETLYLVIPFDSTKIGVCGASDFWDSFSRLMGTRYDIANWSSGLMGRLASEIHTQIESGMISGSSDIWRYSDSWEELLPFLDKKYDLDYWTWGENYKYDMDKTLLENLNLFLDPEKNGFKLVEFLEASKIQEGGCRETWFEDSGVAVNWYYLSDKISNLSDISRDKISFEDLFQEKF